jgi:quinolinate synthase
MDAREQIRELCRERNAINLADFVGDSYGLSRKAAGADAAVILFCGVRFMAETAAILNPGRVVLLPAADAGCPMADMIDADQLRALKAEHPGAPVVCYVNSTAEVKAESTICCTSSNAVKVVRSLGEQAEILFVPDQYLGRFVEGRLGRKLVLWEGFCPTHAMVRQETIQRVRREHPDAQVMVHPECLPEVQDLADHVLSTGQMCELVKTTTCRKFLVGTEVGILHTLKKLAPHIEFIHVTPFLRCPNMRKITLDKILRSLQTLEPRVTVAEPVAAQGRLAIERMLAVADSGG